MRRVLLPTLTIVIGIGALVLLNVGPCSAGPTVTVGAVVPRGQQLPVERIDHSSWDTLLRKYVDGQGYVNYTAWKASAADQRGLDVYLAHLSAASITPQSSREAQLAFWINAYNAVTVKGILREYPTKSIRNHTAKIAGYNIWKNLILPVGGQSYSLDAMEHQVLRKMGEPRIHFAIVCASIGCPRLLNEAYMADRLDEQLTRNTKAFFADPSKLVVDPRTSTIYASPILDWFADDFGTDTAARLRNLAPYLPPSAQELAARRSTRLAFLDYDWGLNDQATLRGGRR
jgi:hypothetical protein